MPRTALCSFLAALVVGSSLFITISASASVPPPSPYQNQILIEQLKSTPTKEDRRKILKKAMGYRLDKADEIMKSVVYVDRDLAKKVLLDLLSLLSEYPHGEIFAQHLASIYTPLLEDWLVNVEPAAGPEQPDVEAPEPVVDPLTVAPPENPQQVSGNKTF